MKLEISVIIPTHNPRPDYLRRVLEALAEQTLAPEKWELVVVDNKSADVGYRISDVVGGLGVKGLRGEGDVAGSGSRVASETGGRRTEVGGRKSLLNARVVREEKLGLTHARKRGFRETTGEVVVMVDDDNVLEPNYLAEAARILQQRPRLGAIGGKCVPEFEVEPEPWMREFLPLLALRDHGEKEIVSGEVRSADGRRAYPDRAAPIGAGMVVRREAARAWLEERETGLPDRKGAELSSAGDNDLVFQILRGGWEVGYFPGLKVTHLIPKERLTEKYLAGANRGIQRSWVQVLRKHDACPWRQVPIWGFGLRKAKSFFFQKAWKPVGFIRWMGSCGKFEGLSLSLDP